MKIYLSWTDSQCPNLNLGSVGSSKVSQHAQNSIRSKSLKWRHATNKGDCMTYRTGPGGDGVPEGYGVSAGTRL